jgi:GNAT superfamily N-acetyltransferase
VPRLGVVDNFDPVARLIVGDTAIRRRHRLRGAASVSDHARSTLAHERDWTAEPSWSLQATRESYAAARERPYDSTVRGHSIVVVTEADLEDLLPLMRAYCDFYETSPDDAGLLALSRAMLADPEHEGVQLIARDAEGAAVGFASVFWSWDTTEATRIGIMNDLYVAPRARGTGLAERLVARCAERTRVRGASRLQWETSPDNVRAQTVYDRIGGVREPWIVYSLPTE